MNVLYFVLFFLVDQHRKKKQTISLNCVPVEQKYEYHILHEHVAHHLMLSHNLAAVCYYIICFLDKTSEIQKFSTVEQMLKKINVHLFYGLLSHPSTHNPNIFFS